MPELRRSHVLTTAAIVFVVVFAGARILTAQRTSPAGGAPAWGGGAAGQAGPQAGAAAVDATPGTGGEALSVDDPGAQPALVHVAGAVRHPGVYRLAAGARVDDAIRRAGGARAGADLDFVNLAAKVSDGQQILVPRRGAAPGGGATGTAGAPAAGATAAAGAVAAGPPIDLNTATAEQLDTLDGVGPATAQKILAYRTEHGGFRSVDELAQVPGIGPKKLAALRDRVRV